MEKVNEERITVKGIIEKITYKNDTNGYTVAIVRTGKEKITVVGTFPFLSEGESAEFTGSYILHPTYGRQFAAESFERIAPVTTAAVLKYLSSGAIKGVGPATASKIVSKFGKDTLDVIQNHPQELAAITGISKEKAISIGEEYKKQFGMKDIMLFLSPYGFSPERCVKVFKEFGENAVSLIKDNPYVLCEEPLSVSFEAAEQIAFDLGIGADSETRLAAGIAHIIKSNLLNGHTCLPKDKVLAVAVKLLECDYCRLEDIAGKMTASLMFRSKIIDGREYLCLPKYFAAESYIAARLTNFAQNSSFVIPVDDLEIDYVENKSGIKFEKAQRDAVKAAFKSGLLVLTGGPGTGKTTTLNAIIQLFETRNMNIALAAPTGRAAKRMTELTGKEAKTIHRLLEVEWTDDEQQKFARNERNTLECDVLIVDEASMLDSLIFESLLRALRLDCRIVLVGDVDQLPSIAAGNVLSDIIRSERFNTVSLKKVFRQAKESLIVTNAHAIINGEETDFSNRGKDFFLMQKDNAYDICNTVLELCAERLPEAYGFDSVKNIQVICPSKKYQAGAVNLNNLLQSCLNPSGRKPELAYKGIYFREGDKVMQIKNNYDIKWEKADGEQGFGVFNGDIGIILSIERATGLIKIAFDDRVAEYYYEEIDQLDLAYAMTVHKSQGSEFDCVILPLFEVPSPLMYRNLLYTAVTRAKKLLVIVGSKKIYNLMAQNDKKTLRYTLLGEFFNEM